MITFILLWVIAVVIFVLDQKNLVQSWFSAALFFAGFNEIHFLILRYLYPSLSKYPLLSDLEHLIIYCSSIFLYPYAFLMGAIYYYSEFDEQWRKRRKSISLIMFFPVLMVYGILLFQLVDFNHPRFHQLCIFWVVPSYLTANFLLIKSFFLAKSQRLRNHNSATCILVTPITIADLTINHLLPWFGFTINLNFVLNIVLFIAFFYLITRYGLLGRKLQIEQLDLDNSIKAMTSGAAILNHSLKNEIAKISMCATNLNFVNLTPTRVKETIRIIIRSTNHIMEMLDHANQCTRDFALVKSVINLKAFLEDILAEFQDQFRIGEIKLITNFGPDVWIKADQLHLGEVFNNLIKNALEAMESGGKMDLTLSTTRKSATITIKDTGVGIPNKLLPHIFEPFYTTKNSRHNFGLGLLYCYKVIKKHGGTIEVKSKPNQGTTFYLNLPRYSKKSFKMTRGASNVQNKSIFG